MVDYGSRLGYRLATNINFHYIQGYGKSCKSEIEGEIKMKKFDDIILDVKSLSVEYHTSLFPVKAVEDVSFNLQRGESVGLVGESGCGKTTVAKALMGMLAKNGKVSRGEIIFKGQDLSKMTKEEIRKLRLKEIAMISQSAMNALNPVYRVGDQIVEGIRAHTNVTRAQALERVEEVFDIIGLKSDRMTAYPHQLSGGMKQRLIIAMALSLNPSLIIADEPTTALDVVVQDKILKEICHILERFNSSMIFITHDIAVVSEICDTIIVMYGGKVMEKAPTKTFFKAPRHPYSLGLQNASPSILDKSNELISIPGNPPNLMEKQTGCRFKDRCPFRKEICIDEEPKMKSIEGESEHELACHFPEKVEEFRSKSKEHETWKMVRDRLVKEREEMYV